MPKLLLAGAIIGVGLFAGYKVLASAGRTQANLEIIPYPKLVGFNEKGFSIGLDINLKNPSSNKFSFKFPHVSVSYGDVLLASSKMVNKMIEVGAYDEVWIRNIQFDVPVLNLLVTAASILAEWKAGKTVLLQIKTTTEVHILNHVQPIDDVKTVPVSKPKILSK